MKRRMAQKGSVEMNAWTDYFSLKDRVALVTGGASGIGKGCAKMLADAGASVMIVSRREEKLQEVKREIEEAGGVCEYFAADLTLEENCKAAVEETVKRFGHLDILVNSAGYVDSKSMMTMNREEALRRQFDLETYKKTMSIDLDSVFLMTKYAYEKCAEGKHGSIINISSTAALHAAGPLAYTAAKGGVRSMTRLLGRRFGDMGVRINTIYPGLIESEMTQGISDHKVIKKIVQKRMPLNMIGTPEDIACCALYLASDASKYVTGQEFVVDGGGVC